MFQQDHRADFDAVVESSSPFAFVRFGDGEISILRGDKYTSVDAWAITGWTRCWFEDELRSIWRAAEPGFCVGVPTPCCLGQFGFPDCGAPLPQQTFATLFLHANTERLGDLYDRFADPLVVSSGYGELRVPPDGVTIPWDLDGLVDELMRSTRPIFLAAGPCANVIAWRYWQRQEPEHRVPILDLGSALDLLHGRATRGYHALRRHRCQWWPRDRA